ncbi:ScbR family autoregulator-binding transcription factor [Streptomyces sp. Tu 3180]|uniref:ScbR family autoregulator-binding transcription factor n=1 Tax=Streptomyces sp. Tu 3180 TaxID=2682611 RepID=UPI001FB71011|nr:ScbR family autoregulator-binding transcription factor [Streptomyces sp. Tu 3180]
MRTREALVRAAAEAFDQDGFAVASLTRISSRAGVSSGALHFHFANKAALADAVEEAAAVVLRTITQEAARPGRSPLQHLIDATHRLAEVLREDVVLRAGFELSGEATRVPRTDLRRCWRHRVEQQVRRCAESGELREDATADQVVTAVVAATVGVEVLGVRDAAWLAPDTIAQLWRLLLPTLASEAALARLSPEGPARPAAGPPARDTR